MLPVVDSGEIQVEAPALADVLDVEVDPESKTHIQSAVYLADIRRRFAGYLARMGDNILIRRISDGLSLGNNRRPDIQRTKIWVFSPGQ